MIFSPPRLKTGIGGILMAVGTLFAILPDYAAAQGGPDPANLDYRPDAVLKDRDGVLLLYSEDHGAVFRWSPEEERYLESIALDVTPQVLTYDATGHDLFLGLDNGEIRRIDALPGAASSLFAMLPERVIGLVATGDHLIAARQEASFAGEAAHVSFTLDGEPVDVSVRESRSRTFEYCPGNRTIYWLSAGRLYSARLTGAGTLGREFEAPYNEQGNDSGAPLRPSASGSHVALAQGLIFAGVPAETRYDLGRRSADMGWVGETMYSVESYGRENTRYNHWTEDWNVDHARVLEGEPLRILPGAERTAVVTLFEGSPRFYLIGPDDGIRFDSVSGRPPVLVEEPADVRVDYGWTARLGVKVSGSGPFEYRWTKNGELLPDATSADLVLENCGSASAGTYQVRIANEEGEVTSRAARLGVGPVRDGALTGPGLLVDAGERIHVVPLGGRISKSFHVPNPYNGGFTHRTDDVVMDDLGRVHVLHSPFDGGNEMPTISTFDPEFESWGHTRLQGLRIHNYQDADLSIAGDRLIMNGQMTVDVNTGHLNRTPDNVFFGLYDDFFGRFRNFTAGLDGFIYTSESGEIRKFDPLTFTLLESTPIDVGIADVSADRDGTLYFITYDDRLGTFQPGADEDPRFVDLTVSNVTSLDFNLSESGRIAVGAPGQIVLSQTALRTVEILRPDLPAGSGYVGWIEDPEIPSPRFIGTPPAETREDEEFLFTPVVDHPDPDQSLGVTLGSAPEWLILDDAGRITGTPTAADIGTSTVRLEVTDSFGEDDVLEFDLEVTEVNDPPQALDETIEEDEDADPVEVDLAELFSDEETSASELSYALIDAGNGQLIETSLDGSRLILTPLPDAFGETNVIARATDPGGLAASSTITVRLAPVNDPPAFRETLPVAVSLDEPVVEFFPASHVTDPDPGDILVYSIDGNTDPAIFAEVEIDRDTGRVLMERAPYVSGVSDLTINVADEAGASAEQTLRITLAEPADPGISAGDIVLNEQTGLYEQMVTVTNVADRAIGGIELVVDGLSEDHELSGVNDGRVRRAVPLAPGESVVLSLSYRSAARNGLPAPELSAASVLPVPREAVEPAGVAVDRIVRLGDGAVLLEFSSNPDRLYALLYSFDMETWYRSPVRIDAGGNRTQVIDRGPPRTDCHPSECASRFYRVVELPE